MQTPFCNLKGMWQIGQDIGDMEGRMDVCVADAGIHGDHIDCLECAEEEFNEVSCELPYQIGDRLDMNVFQVMDVNMKGCYSPCKLG